VIALTLAALAALAGLLLLLPGLGREARHTVDMVAYPLTSLGAGMVLTAASLHLRGRHRWAWLMLSLGVVSWGIAEVGFQVYWTVGREVPYPSWMDVFYLAGYPMLGAGVLLLPHAPLGKFERTRSLLDAAIGAVGLSLVAWLTYLHGVVAFDSEASLLENWINALYPIGDLLLLIAIMALAFRRSQRRFDLELLLVGAALLLTAVADMAYAPLVNADAYWDGMWLDGLWLLAYASFAATAWVILQPSRPRADPHGRYLRRLLIPYAPVLALPVIIMVRGDVAFRYLTPFVVVLVVLMITRQWMATREVREITERQRDGILASVSHELRTPLTAVQGYSQLLSGNWARFDEGERRQMVGDIEDQALHLGRVITDIIDLTRGKTSSLRLDRYRQPVVGVLERAVRALPPDDQARVAIDANPRLIVDADRSRLHQILVNLLTNAVRYGQHRILLKVERAGADILFQVHDDGQGVPRRFEAAIWQRFDRGAHRRDSSVDGLGIGLPIARALVEAHGGTITQHRSAVYGGACFEFTIPVPVPSASSPTPESLPLESTLSR
jgi:signal transduction histidine kinase